MKIQHGATRLARLMLLPLGLYTALVSAHPGHGEGLSHEVQHGAWFLAGILVLAVLVQGYQIYLRRKR
ncbi:MAG: hypothetical protein RQ899_05275 [Pseudomonadales bacterium]|nr:hypothetical protein [Pseudomonadales bacterium]